MLSIAQEDRDHCPMAARRLRQVWGHCAGLSAAELPDPGRVIWQEFLFMSRLAHLFGSFGEPNKGYLAHRLLT
ncbi:hypothetical protein PSEUDO8O_150189 [Pseudomonas sp. 8O]|nr:hypothetical protein PSEUDO8O_150189 [Pseudomonas sp. 8O]